MRMFGMSIKRLACTFCLLAIPQIASAMSAGECSRIASSGDRLACFDKLFPMEKAAGPKQEFRDITVEENARLDKSIKSICRDCTH